MNADWTTKGNRQYLNSGDRNLASVTYSRASDLWSWDVAPINTDNCRGFSGTAPTEESAKACVAAVLNAL